MTSQTYIIPPSLSGLVFFFGGGVSRYFFFPKHIFFAIEDTPKHETLFRSRSRRRERGGADAYVPARLEIHELLNIGVNLYADTNGALPDELYIADAKPQKRPTSEINAQLKGLATVGDARGAPQDTR